MARVLPGLWHIHDISGLGLSAQAACRAQRNKPHRDLGYIGQGSTYLELWCPGPHDARTVCYKEYKTNQATLRLTDTHDFTRVEHSILPLPGESFSRKPSLSDPLLGL
jgi:hypothetical protein